MFQFSIKFVAEIIYPFIIIKMKKKLLKFSIVIVLLFAIPAISLFVLSLVHSKAAHDEFVDIVNRELNGEITFKDFSFSYLKSFPDVHIQIEGVSVHTGKVDVIKVGKLDVLLNLKKLWRKQLKVEKLLISGANIFMEVDSLGNKQHILKKKKKTTGSGNRTFIIGSHDINIKNSKFYFGNQYKGNRTYLQIDNAKFNLSTDDSLLIFAGTLTGKLDSLISHNRLLFANQPVAGKDLVFNYNRHNKYKELVKGYVLAHTLKVTPRLTMKPHNDGQIIDLHIYGENNFDTSLELLEFHTGISFKQVSPNAKLKIIYMQSGFTNHRLRPYSELDFEISDAEFTGEDFPFPINVTGLKGNYNTGKEHSSKTTELLIDTINVTVNESYINGRFKLTNLKDPFVDAHLISQMDMGHLIKGNEKFSLTGTIDADLMIEGKISELKKAHFQGKQLAKGSIDVKDLELVLHDKGYKLELIKGTSLLNNHIFEVTSLVGDFNKAAFHFQGKFDDLGEYILKDKENLEGGFALNFDVLDLRKLNLKPEAKKPDKKSGDKLLFSNIALGFEINGKKVITDFGDIRNLRASSRLDNKMLLVKTLGFLYQDGLVNGSGKVLFNDQGVDSVVASINGRFQNLDIKLPEQKHNQDNVPDKPFKFPMFLDADLDFEIVNGKIEEGQFNNFNLHANINGPEVVVQKFDVEVLGGNTVATGRLLFDGAGLTGVWADADIHFNMVDVGPLLNKFDKKEKANPAKGDFQFPQEMDVKVIFSSSEIVYHDAVVSNLSTQIHATGQQVKIDDFVAGLPFGNLKMDLLISEYQNDNISYSGEVDLSIDSLAVDDLLAMKAFGISDNKNSEKQVPPKSKQNGLPDNINIKLNANARHISYKNASVEDLKLFCDYNTQEINLKELNFKFAEGTVDVYGHVDKDHANLFPGYFYSKGDSIDIKKLFVSFDNFKQDAFTSENSSGKISWASHYYFDLDTDYKLVKDSDLGLVNATIHHAEFNHIVPIEKALFFVGHKAKDKMIVSELDINAFMYKNKIFTSDVLMNDNIANLNMFGEVDLNKKQMDLGIEVSLSDLFFRSKKKRMVETQEGIVTLGKDEKLYLSMSGQLKAHKLKMMSKKKFAKTRKNLMGEIRVAQEEYKKKGE